MRGSRWMCVGATLTVLAGTGALAELPGQGPRLEQVGVDITQEQIANGLAPLHEIRRQGMLVFSTPFNREDGYGDGPGVDADPIPPGGRPTLQANGTFLRVNGLDSQTCLECHAIVSNREVPARLGVGGVGGASDNAIFQPTSISPVDGTFDGRFINPPFLFGSGGPQLLAREMTEDLQALKAVAMANSGIVVPLETHGVSFGSIVYEGGWFDTDNVEGVDDDLVVRPFGRKGEFHTVRGFDQGAMMFHLGMQPVEVVGEGVDADDDGVVDELTVGEMSALEIFNTTLPRPTQQRLDADSEAGEALFEEVGCAGCHLPYLETRSRVLDYRFPGDFFTGEVFYSVDLSRASPRFQRVEGGGIRVPMFADLKRHDMGPGLAEDFGSDLDAEFTTARLWGIWDTAPYLHDGRAPTLLEAILLHGGEAGTVRDDFASLSDEEKGQILSFLATLRTPRKATKDLE